MFQPRNAHPLSLAEIASAAPSAMAVSSHSSRSDRYTYIPTSEVITGMAQAGFLPFPATQSRCRDAERQDFTKHMIRFRQMSDIQRVAIVGELVPEIVLVNAHDGSAAYSLMAGLWRFVCGNGMMVSDSTLASVHIRHSGDIVGQVIEGSLAIAGQSQKALEQVNDWQRLQLTSGEQSVGKRHPGRTVGLWHGMKDGRRLRRVSTRQVKGIDQDVKLNRAMWQLAEKMAELKAA